MGINSDVPGFQDDAALWRDNQQRTANGKDRGHPALFKDRGLDEFTEADVRERDWLVPSVLIRKSVTLFGGDGGVGKSLACMMLQVAAALAEPWLGIDIPRSISSFGFYCEDDEEELLRRFSSICAHYGATFKDTDGLVRFSSRVGERDNELVTFRGKSEYAKAETTDTYQQLADVVKDWNTELVIIDTVSDVFAGNENSRYQTKSFVTLMRKIALINNGGVILTAHPSRAGLLDGSGLSGSTAWNGAVRNRLYLTTPKKPLDEDDGPTDDRVLKVMKSNYGPMGEKIKCRWCNGVFINQDPNRLGSLADRIETDNRIMKAVEYLISNGTRVAAAHKARNGFACLINSLPSCRDLSWATLTKAQDRLVSGGKLIKVEMGPPAKRYVYLRPPHLTYPGEVVS